MKNWTKLGFLYLCLFLLLTACSPSTVEQSSYGGRDPQLTIEAADPFTLEDGTVPTENPYQEAEALLAIPADSSSLEEVARTAFNSYVASYNEMAEEGSKILTYEVKKVQTYGDANEFAALYIFDMTGEENCPYLLGGNGKIDGTSAQEKVEGLRIRKEEDGSYAIIARGEAGIAIGLEE